MSNRLRSGWVLSIAFALFTALAGCSAKERPQTPTSTQKDTASDVPRIFRSTGEPLVEARKRVLAGDPTIASSIKAIRETADAQLVDGPYSVIRKKHALPGMDPHDFLSLAPYFWPNPDTKDHLPYIRHDGEHNPETDDYDTAPLGDMAEHALKLALAGYLTADEKYSARAATLIRVWFFDEATRMNPNLTHAQLVCGVNDGRGTGIIETVRLLGVIDAVGLLHFSKSWSADDQKKIESWFRDYVQWLQTSKNGKDEAAAKNNHGTWYDVQLTAFLLFLNDETAARKVTEAAMKKRIDVQIESDGQQPLELARTKSLGYSTMNVDGLTLLATLGARVNVNLWSYTNPKGGSIRAALDYLIPYYTGEKIWTRKQIVPQNMSILFVPLRRAAVGFSDPHLDDVADNLLQAHPDDFARTRLLDPLRFPRNSTKPH